LKIYFFFVYISGDQLVQMFNLRKTVFLYIGRHRRRFLIQRSIELIKKLINSYENKNNDHRTNGEFFVLRKLSQLKFNVIFDVGANIGNWSITAASIFPTSRIFAFEPVPELYRKCSSRVSKIENISPCNIGLSDQTKTATFNFYPHLKLFNSLYDIPRNEKPKQIKVKMTLGDEFCLNNNIDHIDFLKLDVEGAEYDILNGFATFLREKRITTIQFEYGFHNIITKRLLADYYELLRGLGFVVGKIYPNYVDFRDYDYEMENFIHSNFLAIIKTREDIIDSLSGQRSLI